MYNTGEVLYIDFPHKSFKWANGLYVVKEVKDQELHMYQLDNRGEISNGNCVTSITNTGITKTKLVYQY